MDPAVIGAIIGTSVLIGCGGIRVLADYLERRRIESEQIPLRNPILLKSKTRVKKLFV